MQINFNKIIPIILGLDKKFLNCKGLSFTSPACSSGSLISISSPEKIDFRLFLIISGKINCRKDLSGSLTIYFDHLILLGRVHHSLDLAQDCNCYLTQHFFPSASLPPVAQKVSTPIYSETCLSGFFPLSIQGED